MHKPTHLRSNLLSAASTILVEASKIVVPQRVLDHAKKEDFPQKDAETIYRLWIDRISIAEIMKKISAEAKAAKAPNEAVEVDLGEATKPHGARIMPPKDTSSHTPNVTKALNFAKGFEAAEMESFLLELAEYFMYSHDDMKNAQGVGSLLKKAYTEWKSRKSKNESIELDEAKADIASGRLETQVSHLVNNDWIIKSHTQDVTKQIAIYKSSIKSLKEYLLLDPGIHTKSFVDHKQIKARIQIFEKALAAAEKYQASLK